MFHYQIFGINIASEFFLPGVQESDFSIAELTIRNGSVPVTIDNYMDRGVFYYAAPGQFLFEMDSVGRFLVTNGKEITVEKHEHAKDSEVNLFLLGSVMGAAILQRGLIPMHGSTVTNGKKTIAICGKSGTGKSSLAAEFIKQGFSLVSDDISVIEVVHKKVLVKRGIQHLKLWADSIHELELNLSGLSRVRSSLEKYYVPCTELPVPLTRELNAIIVLKVKNSEGYQIKELNGIEKFEVIRSNIYRGIYIEPLGLTDKSFQTVTKILEHIDVYRIARPISPLNIKELADFIDANLKL